MPAIISSPGMRQLIELVERIAQTNAAVLITGESGSGKELIARAVHHYSLRCAKPWVDVSCAALPEHLVESELFGYEKGAFSGADSPKPGLFELANHGTLFLDEVGELEPRMQVKLLRVLDGVAYYRLGGTRKVTVDVRIVAATNQDLEHMVETGQFRGDLYHRLGQICLRVPPLRERPEDIVPLAEHFLKQTNPRLIFSGEALQAACSDIAGRATCASCATWSPRPPCWRAMLEIGAGDLLLARVSALTGDGQRRRLVPRGPHRESGWHGKDHHPAGAGSDQRPPAEGRGVARHLAAHAEPQAETLRKGGRAAVLRFLSATCRPIHMSAADRRTERRYRGQGPLKLSFDDPSPQEIIGRLLDYSKSGFRAVHAYAALHTGQVVDFQHAIAGGKARVMWNRIADDRVETGFS